MTRVPTRSRAVARKLRPILNQDATRTNTLGRFDCAFGSENLESTMLGSADDYGSG
jgi:hypothetical protein